MKATSGRTTPSNGETPEAGYISRVVQLVREDEAPAAQPKRPRRAAGTRCCVQGCDVPAVILLGGTPWCATHGLDAFRGQLAESSDLTA